jgi:hypothetical protein
VCNSFISIGCTDQLCKEAIYNPPTVTQGEPTACLVKDESKTILYGNPGDQPWNFTLRPEEEGDVGYLKLFVSDCYLDLSHLQQSMLFGPWKGAEGSVARTFSPSKIRASAEPEEETKPYELTASGSLKLFVSVCYLGLLQLLWSMLFSPWKRAEGSVTRHFGPSNNGDDAKSEGTKSYEPTAASVPNLMQTMVIRVIQAKPLSGNPGPYKAS